jgi:hypothetical protein
MDKGPLTKKKTQSDAAIAARARNVVLARAAKDLKRQQALPPPAAVKPAPVKPARVAEEPVPPPTRKERPAAKQAPAPKRRMRKVVSYETDSDSESESESDDEPPQRAAAGPFGQRFGGGSSSAFQSVFSS